MALQMLQAHIKACYDGKYRRFALPFPNVLPNNDLPYFDDQVWSELKQRLKMVFPDLSGTPFLIFCRGRLHGPSCTKSESPARLNVHTERLDDLMDALALHQQLLDCELGHICCRLIIKPLFPPTPDPVSRYVASIDQLDDHHHSRLQNGERSLDNSALRSASAISAPIDPSANGLSSSDTMSTPINIPPVSSDSCSDHSTRRRTTSISRAVNACIGQISNLNRSLGEGLKEVASFLQPSQPPFSRTRSAPCTMPSANAELVRRLKAELDDMGLSVHEDVLSSLVSVYDGDINAVVTAAIGHVNTERC
eukprot:TRINITY_DN2335_c0_g1_i1.p1 TRINITY_DN2335_c0_g1~~TRINITY_DN2335_c0_g1_i1.p1  ORF type:complete len:308 (+),score=26.08 TRINITY_DN2335_c0_g1_i1:77-1000(+)